MRILWPIAGVTIAAGLSLVAEPGLGQFLPQLQPSLEITLSPDTDIEIETEPLRRKRLAPVDPYAAVGIGMGVFTFYPSLTVADVITSNVEQAPSGAQSAAGIRLQPSLRFESDWVRHSWTGEGNYDWISYLDHEELTSHEADLYSKFRLDIRRTTRAEFEAGYDLDQTGLADSEIPETAVGFRAEHMNKTAATLIHDFGPLESRVKAG
ncbi:MAG: outer membrane beta-barrel protein, partial [Rhizobiales bacterium]|nr:outer membrane beta-barrel protein [Hyphomicrobiales bacterium]